MEFILSSKNQFFVLLTSACISVSAHAFHETPQYKGRMELLKKGYEERLSNLDSRLTTKAFVYGNLVLRDAKYRYHEQVLRGTPGFILFSGAGCDIFQVVLTVNSGAVTLIMQEYNTFNTTDVQRGTNVYPDTLTPESGMFSYTLYSSNLYKSIGIGIPSSSSISGADVTAFGYCFSTNSAAYSVFFNNRGEVIEK